ncbi:MAG: DUF6463 family protein [Stackebrandtia sp.]
MSSVTSGSVNRRPTRRLTLVVGVGLIFVSAFHLMLFFVASGHVGDWLGGDLYTDVDPFTRMRGSEGFFWASLGSFAAPLGLIGAWAIHTARSGAGVPAFVGWTLAAWGVVGFGVYPVGGFPLSVLFGVLLAIDGRRAARQDEQAQAAPNARTVAST